MRWLLVTPYLPHPAIGHGGGTAVWQVCRALNRVHELEVLAFERAGEAAHRSALASLGVGLHTLPFLSDRERGGARLRLVLDRAGCAVRAAWRGRPLMVEKYDRAAMHAALRARIAAFGPDVVQIEYSFLAPYARTARQTRGGGGPAPRVLLNTHELASLPRLRRAQAAGSAFERRRWQAEACRWQRFGTAYVQWADAVLCVTEQDRRRLAEATGSRRLHTVPLGVEVSSLPVCDPAPEPPPRLLFVGSFRHPPNLEAARRLIDEILPRVWRSHPQTRLDLVGAPVPPILAEAAARDSRIQAPGFVDDLGPWFDRAWLFVAPLFEGGGIKIKILEAMGRGAPVVTTAIGAEGIDESGQACILSPDVDGFAAAVTALLDQAASRQDLGRRARTWIEERYDWTRIVEELTRVALREGPGG